MRAWYWPERRWRFTFLFAGVGKLTGDWQQWLDNFAKLRPPWLPEWFASIYANVLPFVEATSGALLIVGLLSRLASGVMTLLLVSFLIAVGFWSQRPSPHPNVVFVTLALLLTLAGPGRIALDTWLFGSPGPKRGPALQPQAGPGPMPR